MKRFYKIVTTQESAGIYKILLDGRPIKTPQKNTLATEHKNLAEAIMLEWAAQKDNILPDTMPLTQILTTKIDRVTAMRDEMAERLLKYLDTDLVCYRAGDQPDIAKKQAALWDPALKWFEQKCGVALKTTNELQAVTQPQKAREEMTRIIENLDDNQFAILQLATSIAGSIILGLMFQQGAIDAETLLDASRVEENHYAALYRADKYGPDPMQEKKDFAALQDLKAAENFIYLTKA